MAGSIANLPFDLLFKAIDLDSQDHVIGATDDMSQANLVDQVARSLIVRATRFAAGPPGARKALDAR